MQDFSTIYDKNTTPANPIMIVSRKVGFMDSVVYVDVLLILNYLINMLLILCMAKLAGRTPKRRRIVAAALFGSLCSLTIFLPFMGFFLSILSKLLISAVIVLIAFPYINPVEFIKQLFLFFAVSFFFAGVMLGIWMAFTPNGMTYYNGVVYFNISSFSLIVATMIAYGLLLVGNRLARGGRLHTVIYKTTIFYGGKATVVTGLVDSGNSLYEPFSDTPVVVCWLEDIASILPREAVRSIRNGTTVTTDFAGIGMKMRLIPYDNIGGAGVIPAFKADKLILTRHKEKIRVESVYIAVSSQKVGDSRFNAILNPDLISMKI